MKVEVEQAVSTGDYTELEDRVDEIKSSHASGGVKAHASGGMVSRTARRYAKQVLRHMKKIAKASHGRLGVYTLSELMNEGKAKTAFARAVIERAMISGITPAQAAKELMEQRGEARMMAKSGKSKNDTTEFHLNRTSNELSNNIFKVKSERKYKGEIQEFIEGLSEDTNRDDGIWYLSKDRKRLFRINTSLEHYKENKNETGYGFEVADWYDFTKFTDEQKSEFLNRYNNDEIRGTISGWLQNIELETGADVSSDGLLQDQEAAADNVGLDEKALQGKSVGRRGVENSRTDKREGEGLDLSGVQLMEGSDGTVYGWCEIERDAEGNVVARHIYLNDEVLNANTMVHELG